MMNPSSQRILKLESNCLEPLGWTGVDKLNTFAVA